MSKFLNYLQSREWVATVGAAQALALAILEWTDVLPDGAAKGWIIIAATTVSVWVTRAKVFAAATVQ